MCYERYKCWHSWVITINKWRSLLFNKRTGLDGMAFAWSSTDLGLQLLFDIISASVDEGATCACSLASTASSCLEIELGERGGLEGLNRKRIVNLKHKKKTDNERSIITWPNLVYIPWKIQVLWLMNHQRLGQLLKQVFRVWVNLQQLGQKLWKLKNLLLKNAEFDALLFTSFYPFSDWGEFEECGGVCSPLKSMASGRTSSCLINSSKDCWKFLLATCCVANECRKLVI